MEIDRQIGLAYTARKLLIVALVCTICLMVTIVPVVVLNQFSVHGNIYYSYIIKHKSLRFHQASDRFNSVDRSSSVVQIKGQPPLLTSFRPANLSSVHQDPLITAELPPAPVLAPISIDSHECKRACGKVAIPYPFGLSPECARSSQYELNCIDSNNSLAQENLKDPSGPWPFLSTMSGPFQVTNITSEYLIINATKIKAMAKTPAQNGDCSGNGNASLVLEGPYMMSSQNFFFVSGCRSRGAYSLDSPSELLNSNVVPTCGPLSCTNQYQNPVCNVYDCCTLSISASRKIYMMGSGIQFKDFKDYCGFSSIVYPESYSTWNPSFFGTGEYGVQLLWAIMDHKNCTVAKSQPDYACSDQSLTTCIDVDANLGGYVCKCTATGYEGDGYKNGTRCADVDECLHASLNHCAENATCTNLPGSYNCSCEKGLIGDGFSNSTDCVHPPESNPPKSQVALISGIASGLGIFITINVVVMWCLRRRWRNRLGDSYDDFQPSNISFQATLMELQKRDGANVCKIFSLEELKQATNNFSRDHELGSGGFGTVFQGVLEDGMCVAIKKPKNEVGERRDDIKQFINEVTILSQVNHRNLVRLLGCCLETRAPLLVYEYVSNGNLLEHLQAQKKNEHKIFIGLDWDKRLDIAIGIAEALNYLHFGTSPPIYHRDVKSSNILLDDKYRAKVADFGISRLIPIEATHVSTMLQGTPGYLDPEFLETMQVSDKSDVYSFGVVLLELITAEKPIDLSREPGNQNLVLRVSRLLKEARLEDIFDVALNASFDSHMLQAIYKVAQVALKCVERYREYRPSMREVLDELLLIKKSYKGLSHTKSFESSEKDWLPLKAGMSNSSGDFGFESSHQSTSFLFYGSNTSSYPYASSSSMEFPQR